MRKYLVLFAICIYGFVSTAQNVGIGTPNPQNKLHVAGGFRLDTLTGVNGAGLLWHNPNGVVYGIKFTGNANDVLRGDGTFGSFAGSGTNYWLANGTHIYNNNTGNVGIGTTTPSSGLELRGPGLGAQQRITDAVSGNSLVLQSGPGANLKVTGYNYGTGTAQPLYLSVEGANTFINPNGGSIGMGTTTPHGAYRLDVAGPVKCFADAAHFVAHATGGTNSWARFYMRSVSQSWFIGTSQNFNGNQLYIADETYNRTRFSIQPAGGPIYIDGNVGIGTTNPLTKLHIVKDDEALRITGNNPYLLFNNGTVNKGHLLNNGNHIVVGTSPDNTAGEVHLSVYNQIGLAVQSDGRVRVGPVACTIPLASFFNQPPSQPPKLSIFGGLGFKKSYSDQIGEWGIMYASTTNSSNNLVFYFNGGEKAYVNNFDGQWTTFSDIRLKENFEHYRSVLEGIKKIDILTYHYKDDKTGTRSFGLVAQNLQQYFPELVPGNEKKGYLGIAYAKTGVLAIKAIQEQQVIIEEQQRKIDQLEKRLAALENKLSAH